jgi:hypothetical protein
MKRKVSIKELLHWNLTQSEASAPPAPSARRLLEAARPWWEARSEQFQAWAEQLGRIQIPHGETRTKLKTSSTGHLVAVLMIHRAENIETSARVIYMRVRDGRLRLRIRMKNIPLKALRDVEVTFVNSLSLPLFSGAATSLKNKEYRLDVELPERLACDWAQVKVKDRMPFRLLVLSSETKA